MSTKERIALLKAEQRTMEEKYHNFRTGVSNAVQGLPKEYARYKEIDAEIQTLKSQRIAELTAEHEALEEKCPKFMSALNGVKKRQKEIFSEIRAIQQS